MSMKLIHDVLKECGYVEATAFSFVDLNETQENAKWKNRLVTPFLSRTASLETYLMISVEGSELPHLLDGDFQSSIMLSFGKTKFYSPDMDRNTTLLLLCRREEGEKIDHNAKVQIEDDPYYFKKYVFTYTEQEAAAATRYIEANPGSLQQIIHSCLMDTALFTEYKNHIAEGQKNTTASKKKTGKGRKKAAAKPEQASRDNQKTDDHLAYGFFVELATKITVLPIRPSGDTKITPIAQCWENELQKIPKIDDAALTDLLKIVPEDKKEKENLKADDILARWQELTKSSCN